MSDDLAAYQGALREYITRDYHETLREPGNPYEYPFLVPGSATYSDNLWDWDSWLYSIALGQIVTVLDSPEAREKILPYQQGCVLNFLSWADFDGWVPINVERGESPYQRRPAAIYKDNMHKPVLAQHAAFITSQLGGDAEWLRGKFEYLQAFINAYKNHHRHRCGLYYWQNDNRIGVDNDPCTYFRPPASSASIYLNCLMYMEIQAITYLCERLSLHEVAALYRRDAADLREAVQEHCWDDRDGFFYNVDLNLLPADEVVGLHQGMPRDWDCLIQRIGVWSGFLGLWAGLATPEQAERVVAEHYRNGATFNAPAGVRTLSRMEKMYNVRGTNNPSSWLGPIWGVANYLTFRGLVRYGFDDDARELATKTIRLFGRDLERFGALHEYYQPDNGEPIMNRGFQNWNFLVLNMMAWLNGETVITEYVNDEHPG